MRMATQVTRQPPKNPMSAASKISKVVTEFFLPLADGFVPAYTPLTATPDEEENLLLERIWEMFPEAMRTREDFVAKMGELYDSADAERATKRLKNEQRTLAADSSEPSQGSNKNFTTDSSVAAQSTQSAQ